VFIRPTNLGRRFLKIVRGKHKLRIVWELRRGWKLFGEIRRTLSLGGGLMSIMKFEIKTDSG